MPTGTPLTAEVIAGIQEDRDSGMPITEVAVKWRVDPSLITKYAPTEFRGSKLRLAKALSRGPIDMANLNLREIGLDLHNAAHQIQAMRRAGLVHYDIQSAARGRAVGGGGGRMREGVFTNIELTERGKKQLSVSTQRVSIERNQNEKEVKEEYPYATGMDAPPTGETYYKPKAIESETTPVVVEITSPPPSKDWPLLRKLKERELKINRAQELLDQAGLPELAIAALEAMNRGAIDVDFWQLAQEYMEFAKANGEQNENETQTSGTPREATR